MTRSEYQQMSTGYSPLRLATPSGTGKELQPCANCGQPVRLRPADGLARRPAQWVHVNGPTRPCPVVERQP